MLPSMPPDRDTMRGTRAIPIPFFSLGTPPGEDGVQSADRGDGYLELENAAAHEAHNPEGVEQDNPADGIDFLQLVREAEDQASLYAHQTNRRAWSQTYRAYHNEHYLGSKYNQPDWRGRSKLFVPKTRAAVRKDNAAVAASLFNNIDAINCLPGDESNPRQRAAAAVMEQLVNYRTDRASGRASFPWFLVSMGARQNAVLTGVCLTKQSWKQEWRKTKTEEVFEPNQVTGVYEAKQRDVFEVDIDRPDMQLIPSENYVIDASADWTNPAQDSAFIIIKWPMQMEEIRAKQDAPVNPWHEVSESILKASQESVRFDTAAIRRAREQGQDRFDETQTGITFQIIWVYEVFMRTHGEDFTFYSVGDQAHLTDPKPVREVYPEQHGERPLALGYGSLESHRIYPMSPAESWQPLQMETNDLRNLMLDATKQNVMPVTKVVRGRQIDLDQVRRRSSGSSIIVTNKDDVTWENPPQMPQTAVVMKRELDLELDDLAGQQNYSNVENSNALGKTLGGLKLAAGAANAVQEFDIRVWIETWASPALAQIVRLEQYYESDAVVLGICGQKAQLFEKYGINKIDDELLEENVTVRVSVGLGAGDPQQRLAKFQAAASIAAPLIAQSPEFQRGEKEIDTDAIIEEIFGAAGYRDGGARFFKKGNPQPNPMADLQTRALEAKITKDEQTGKAAMFTGIAALAKVALGKRQLEADVVDTLLGHQSAAQDRGFEHAHRNRSAELTEAEHGHRHGLAIAGHRHQTAQDKAKGEREERAQAHAEAQAEAQAAAAAKGASGGDAGMSGQGAPASAKAPSGPQGQGPASPPPSEVILQLLEQGNIEFTRDPKTDRINGFKLPQQNAKRLPAPA